MKKPIAVLFDMDGVLVDNHEYHYQSWLKFGEKYSIPMNKDKFLSFFGSSAKEAFRDLFGHELTLEEIKEYAGEKEMIYREIYRPYLKPVNGLKKFLKTLNDEKIDMAIATSAPLINVEFVLNELDIHNTFKVIVHDAHFKHGKPDPEVYLKAAEMLGYSPAQCIVFEDSLQGIEAARRAGMKVVGVATTHTSDKINHTDKVINDFSEIEVVDIYKILKVS